MARPVRRSQRGKRQTYQVGDVVEIVRGDGVAPGQLLHKMENAKSSNSDPFWLVAFDDGTRDEEICEKSFGPLLQSGGSASTTSNVGGRGGGRRGRNKTTGGTVDKSHSSEETSGGGSAANSEEDGESTAANDADAVGRRKRGRGGDVGGTTKKRRHRPGGSGASNDGETAGDKMATKESDDVAASHREGDADADAGSNVADDYDDDSGVNTRSRRRNRTGSPLGGGLDYKTGRNKKGKNHRKGGKRRHQFHQQLYYRRQREWEHDPNETVEKVKFLTGTLFLYRGENPRAVFVRSS